MSLRYDDYQKVLKNEHFHRQLQSGLMAGQMALLTNMSGMLNHLHNEMAAIRQMNLEGLAIQQEMLQRDQLQGQLEEFIYNTEKMVDLFSDAGCDLPPSARYFSLRGVRETVQQVGIGTALIRGRDNKAAFEAAMEGADGLLGQLKTHPEVIEALEWVKAEQKRLADERARQQKEQQRIATEQQRLLTDREAKRQPLLQEIARLKGNRKPITFSDWYQPRLGKYHILLQIYLWAPLVCPLPPIGLYGFVWIPIWYLISKKPAERQMNAEIDAQINMLEQQLISIP